MVAMTIMSRLDYCNSVLYGIKLFSTTAVSAERRRHHKDKSASTHHAFFRWQYLRRTVT